MTEVPIELSNPVVGLGTQAFLGTISADEARTLAGQDRQLNELEDDQLRRVLVEAGHHWRAQLEEMPHIGVVYATLVADVAQKRLGAIGAYRRGTAEPSPALDARMANWIDLTVWALLELGSAFQVVDASRPAWETFAKGYTLARTTPDHGQLRLREVIAACRGRARAARMSGARDEMAEEEVAGWLAPNPRQAEAQRYMAELDSEDERLRRARERFLQRLDEHQRGVEPPADEQQAYLRLINRLAHEVQADRLTAAQARAELEAAFAQGSPPGKVVYFMTLFSNQLAQSDPARALPVAELNDHAASLLTGEPARVTRGYTQEALGAARLNLARSRPLDPGRPELCRAAAQALEQALPILDADGQPGAAAVAVERLGLALQGAGDLERARDCALDAIRRWQAIAPEDRSPTGLAESYGNLASAQENLGETTNAFESHRRALDLFREAGEPAGVRDALTHLTRLGEATGRSDDVLAVSMQAAEALDKLADIRGSVEVMISIARQSLRLHRALDAIRSLERAEALLRPKIDREDPDLDLAPLYSDLLTWRGTLVAMIAAGDHNRGESPDAVKPLRDGAYRDFEQARMIAAQLQDHDRVARAIVQKAKLFVLLDEPDLGREQAELIEMVPARAEYAIEAKEALALLALRGDQPAEAAQLFAEVADGWGRQNQADRRLAALFRLGEAHAAVGEPAAAVVAWGESLSAFEASRGQLLEDSRIAWGATVEGGYERLVALLADPDGGVFDPMRALAWAERAKSRTFLELLGLTSLPAPATDAADAALLRAEEQRLEHVNDLRGRLELATDATQRFALQRELAVSMEELQRIWEQLRPTHEEYVSLRQGRPLDWGELRELVRD